MLLFCTCLPLQSCLALAPPFAYQGKTSNNFQDFAQAVVDNDSEAMKPYYQGLAGLAAIIIGIGVVLCLILCLLYFMGCCCARECGVCCCLKRKCRRRRTQNAEGKVIAASKWYWLAFGVVALAAAGSSFALLAGVAKARDGVDAVWGVQQSSRDLTWNTIDAVTKFKTSTAGVSTSCTALANAIQSTSDIPSGAKAPLVDSANSVAGSTSGLTDTLTSLSSQLDHALSQLDGMHKHKADSDTAFDAVSASGYSIVGAMLAFNMLYLFLAFKPSRLCEGLFFIMSIFLIVTLLVVWVVIGTMGVTAVAGSDLCVAMEPSLLAAVQRSGLAGTVQFYFNCPDSANDPTGLYQTLLDGNAQLGHMITNVSTELAAQLVNVTDLAVVGALTGVQTHLGGCTMQATRMIQQLGCDGLGATYQKAVVALCDDIIGGGLGTNFGALAAVATAFTCVLFVGTYIAYLHPATARRLTNKARAEDSKRMAEMVGMSPLTGIV